MFPDHDSDTLPAEAGYYWWREDAQKEWRMVQVIDFGSVEDPHLCAYDIEMKQWGGRSLKIWGEHDSPGEWVQLRKPNNNSSALIGDCKHCNVYPVKEGSEFCPKCLGVFPSLASSELARILLMHAVNGIFDTCGNSYANAYTEQWLTHAKSLGAYHGRTIGVISILRQEWEQWLDENGGLPDWPNIIQKANSDAGEKSSADVQAPAGEKTPTKHQND